MPQVKGEVEGFQRLTPEEQARVRERFERRRELRREFEQREHFERPQGLPHERRGRFGR
jgi:hypothetical protein